MKKENVIIGTLVLSMSSIFVRMIGFLFRIYLSNTMGAEGMGVYTLILSLYGLSATLAAAGIGTAVSKLVAEEIGRGNGANGQRILHRAVRLSLLISCTVAAILFLQADFFASQVLGDARAALSLRFLAPGLPFMSVSACMRGYFLAQRHTVNPAVSQVLEQLCKMAFIMLLIGYWLPKGIEYGCALVILGITIGEVICFLYTVGGYARLCSKQPVRRIPDSTPLQGATRAILQISVPLTLTSGIRSALRLMEDVLILAGLKTYAGRDDLATGTYGMLKGMVMPLLIFPLSLLSAFVVMLTPEISRLDASGNRKKLAHIISKILQYTTILGIFIICVFMSFSYELGVVIYNDAQVGEMLRLMSLLCPFMCIEMVVVSILQGMGQQFHSLAYGVTDCVLRVALVYMLIPTTGVTGFLVMVVISNLFTSILNLRRLLKITDVRLRINDWVIKPSLAALTAVQGVRAVCNLYLFEALSLRQGLVVGFALILLIYTAALLSLECIGVHDFAWIAQRLRLSTKRSKPVFENNIGA